MCAASVQEVVGGDAEVARGQGCTLVFAANVAAADSAAAALAEAGLEPLLYHRGVPAEQRAAALDAMRNGCCPAHARCRLGPGAWGQSVCRRHPRAGHLSGMLGSLTPVPVCSLSAPLLAVLGVPHRVVQV